MADMKSNRTPIAITAVLVLDVLFLLAALGLHIWALHYLSLSLWYGHGFGDSISAPYARLFTQVETQTVTGYAYTTWRPATTTTVSAQSTEMVETSQRTAVYTFTTTYRGATLTMPAAPIAYSPTTTFTRLRTTTAMLGGVRGYDTGEFTPLPLATASVTGSPPTFAPAPFTAAAPTSSVTLYAGAQESIDTTATDYFGLYYTVAINHGFNKHFIEADVKHDYATHSIIGQPDYSTAGYPPATMRRIAALLSLVVVAVCATAIRLGVALIRWRRADAASTLRRRPLLLDGMCSFVLLATFLPFWIVYGVWTNPSAMVRAAFAWFNAQPQYNGLQIDALYDVHPWPGVAVAYVVVWGASVLSSMLVLTHTAAAYIRDLRSAKSLSGTASTSQSQDDDEE